MSDKSDKRGKMEELANQKCVACDRGAPKADDGLIHQFSQTSDEWDLVKEDDIPKLMRIYKFNNFKSALEFSNLIGDMAEEEGHHPLIITEWGKVTIKWWTHKIKNLHLNDLIAAAKTENLYINVSQ